MCFRIFTVNIFFESSCEPEWTLLFVVNGLAGQDVIGIQCVNTLKATTIYKDFLIIHYAATVVKYAQKQCKNAHAYAHTKTGK